MDSDSSQSTPVTEPRHVCAVYEDWDIGSLAGPHTTLRGGEVGHLGPISKMRKLKRAGCMTAEQQPPRKGWQGENSGPLSPLTSRPQLPALRLPASDRQR